MRRTSSILIAHHFAPLCLKNLIRALSYTEDMQASTAADENPNREPLGHYTNILHLSPCYKSCGSSGKSRWGARTNATLPAIASSGNKPI
jgi:hypothetical protein